MLDILSARLALFVYNIGKGEGGGGGVSQSTPDLKGNNENIEIGTHFNQLSQPLLSPIVGQIPGMIRSRFSC